MIPGYYFTSYELLLLLLYMLLLLVRQFLLLSELRWFARVKWMFLLLVIRIVALYKGYFL